MYNTYIYMVAPRPAPSPLQLRLVTFTRLGYEPWSRLLISGLHKGYMGSRPKTYWAL